MCVTTLAEIAAKEKEFEDWPKQKPLDWGLCSEVIWNDDYGITYCDAKLPCSVHPDWYANVPRI